MKGAGSAMTGHCSIAAGDNRAADAYRGVFSAASFESSIEGKPAFSSIAGK